MGELSIFAAARETPTGSCLIANDRMWSFAEIAGRTASAIAILRALGVRSGQRVALTPRADVDSAVWLYGLFELGCPAVLLHPQLTERERGIILDEAGPAHVVVDPAPIDSTVLPALDRVEGDHTLAIVYTSGSRGAPRGALLSRRAFVASAKAHAANLGWREDDRWFLGMPPAHVGGLSILTRCLMARRCVVMGGGSFDVRATIEIMERHAVTLCSLVPTMLRRLLDVSDPAWTPAPELRAVLVGGAPFPAALRQRAASRGLVALATYGCTEACSQIATQRPSQAGLPGCGAPLPGIDVRIERGEIQVRGDVVMDGYLHGSAADAPFTEDGWLRTGDLGELAPDGQLVVHGRVDDLIVTGGENVMPQEVEAWLRTVPGVASACVFAVPDDQWGQQVVAAIVVDAVSYDPAVLRASMVEGLASYKRPKRVAVLDTLPLSRSGKVDRMEVAAVASSRLAKI